LEEAPVKHFVDKHSAVIQGVLESFDRLIVHGHLPIAGARNLVAWAVKEEIAIGGLAARGSELRQRIKAYAQALARKGDRPYLRPGAGQRKEDLVRGVIEQRQLSSGLVCVLEAQELSPAILFVGRQEAPRVVDGQRLCQVFYFYHLDQEFGLTHLRLQGWFPFDIQVYLNGHHWLERQLLRDGVSFVRRDNALLDVSDPQRAQELADHFVRLKWKDVLGRWATRFNPLLRDVFKGMRYRWFIDQAEVATDVIFRSVRDLQPLYQRLLHFAIVALGSREIMSFLGKKLSADYRGEVVSDLRRRFQGWRVKHWVRRNALKLYDKFARVLRVETTFNCLPDFTVKRAVHSPKTGQTTIRYAPMRKAIEFLPHVLEIGRRANRRYLDALAAVDPPQETGAWLLAVARPAQRRGEQRFRPLNILADIDVHAFRAVMRGDWQLRGMRNADVRRLVWLTPACTPQEERRHSAAVTRLFTRLRAHGLLAKIPNTRRWRPTPRGLAVMGKALDIRNTLWPLDRAA
jgi:hypothetical protein